MREVVLDTETTGLDPKSGHRIVEIGCVELLNHVATGETYHCYLNPERDMPAEAQAVHGLSEEFLSDKPMFATVAEDFLAFLGDAPLIIHNADFDMGFINAELLAVDREPLEMSRTIDTVHLARRKFPGAPANLDALCKRFNVDNSDRALHGGLKDAYLLAEVYLHLIGGRQRGLELAAETVESRGDNSVMGQELRSPRPHAPTPEEEAAHASFLEKFEAPLWNADGSNAGET